MDITTDNKEDLGNINNILIAAYGTLREGFGNNRLIPKGCHIGTGLTVEKYTMKVAGIPYVSKKPTSNIVVDVYEINQNTLERLDSLEGHPRWYKREVIPVNIDNKQLDCWLYFNDSDNGTILESGDYKKRN